MNSLKNLRVVLHLAAGLMLLAIGQTVWAEGCTVSNLIPDQIVDVGDFDGNMTCANWPTMEDGCLLDPQEGGLPVECTLVTGSGSITVTAEKIDGVITWSAESTEEGLGVDKVILDNATNANGCLQNNKFDAFGGGIVFIKSNGAPSSTRGVQFCADAEIVEVPTPDPVAVTPKACQTAEEIMNGTNGSLDQTGVKCPVYPVGHPNAGQIQPVVVCNFEKDEYAWGVIGSNEQGNPEEVCCQCGIVDAQACFVSDDPADNAENCDTTLASDPSETVILTFEKDALDPCTRIVAGGKVYNVCW